MQVAAYVRVSTDEQGESGAGIAAQRAAIEAECERRGWEIAAWFEDVGRSARNLNRPAIRSALETLKRGEAGGLVVAKLDRLSRSMLDFTVLMARAQRERWAIVALDAPVDTTTPAGEAMAHVLATFAHFERRLIGQRTKEALAARKAAGTLKAPCGRRRAGGEVVERILAERSRPRPTSYRAIAEQLNAEGIPTSQGGARWYASSVQAAERAAAATV